MLCSWIWSESAPSVAGNNPKGRRNKNLSSSLWTKCQYFLSFVSCSSTKRQVGHLINRRNDFFLIITILFLNQLESYLSPTELSPLQFSGLLRSLTLTPTVTISSSLPRILLPHQHLHPPVSWEREHLLWLVPKLMRICPRGAISLQQVGGLWLLWMGKAKRFLEVA